MKHLLITGDPGVGKTTLVKKIIENLSKSSILFDGFITEEVRNHSFHRTGFEVRLLKSNDVAVLADKNKYGHCRVRKRQKGPIIIKLFAIIAALLQENGILIIDEIGKMELFSKKFEQCVETAFKKKNIRILATVPVRGPPFVAALKRDNGCQLFTVTRENRDSLTRQQLPASKTVSKNGPRWLICHIGFKLSTVVSSRALNIPALLISTSIFLCSFLMEFANVLTDEKQPRSR
ncbi:hypothetical protein HUJ04_001586 [Dendroctonus ponderosae]|nr:hypothetical protein HUJ04_001586 [Dendroctonus ponderosae]